MKKQAMKQSPRPANLSTENCQPAVRTITAEALRSVSGGLSFTTTVSKASPKL